MDQVKAFEIRWGDLDPNRHVSNTAYMALMTERRLAFLAEHGFTQSSFEHLQIGPVILSEEFFYLKEVTPGSTVYIDVELLSHTQDYKFIRFSHSLFNEEGKMAVYSTLLFTWMDLKERKAIPPPEELKEIMQLVNKSEQYKVMSEEEIRGAKIPMRRLHQTILK